MKTFFEVILIVIIVSILILFLGPTHLLMPDSADVMLTLGLIVAFLVFMGMFWKEKAGDERDSLHIQKSGKLSFFVGITILIIGIIIQATMYEVDPWLLLTFSGMVLTKLLSRIYHRFKN